MGRVVVARGGIKRFRQLKDPVHFVESSECLQYSLIRSFLGATAAIEGFASDKLQELCFGSCT